VVVLPAEGVGLYIVEPFEAESSPGALYVCPDERGDKSWPRTCSIPVTNTIVSTLIADLILILLAFSAWRFYRKGADRAPKGFLNAFEAIIEFLWNSVSGSAGTKWAKRILPVVATIFLLIFAANMVKLIPGFESIGQLHSVKEAGTAYGPKELFHIGDFGVYTIDKGCSYTVSEKPVGNPAEGDAAEAGKPDLLISIPQVVDKKDINGDGDTTDLVDRPAPPHGCPFDAEVRAGTAFIDAPAEGTEGTSHAGGTELCIACEVVPFLRGTATDINFPFALAILTVLLTQVYGVWAQGPKYFEKFFQIRRLVKGGPFGVIDFGVGLLEVILEFAKILSFGFRLFGNIFAGALLLSIIGALTAVVVPAGLYIFEVFFGIIQAYVFFLLATIFISGATVAHGHEEQH
jgi:F-type H+-transporting ATPase subunit a